MMSYFDMYGERAYESHIRRKQNTAKNRFDSYMKEEREAEQCADGKNGKKDC